MLYTFADGSTRVRSVETRPGVLEPCLVSGYRGVYQTILDHEGPVTELLSNKGYAEIGPLANGLRDFIPRYNPALRRCDAILAQHGHTLFDATFSQEVCELERHGVQIMVLTYIIMHIKNLLPKMSEEQARTKVTELRNHAKQYEIDLGHLRCHMASSHSR